MSSENATLHSGPALPPCEELGVYLCIIRNPTLIMFFFLLSARLSTKAHTWYLVPYMQAVYDVFKINEVRCQKYYDNRNAVKIFFIRSISGLTFQLRELRDCQQ